MMPDLSVFESIAGVDGIYTASNGKLRCVAIRLSSGGLCLYSPVAGLSKKARQSLDGLGKVDVLLAPNQYHNKGLVEYHTAFPEAVLLAPLQACARLEKVTGLLFASLEGAGLGFPERVRVAVPEGLKTGEIWMVVDDALIVVDAFAGPGKPGGAAQLLKTFPRYGVGNVSQYVKWARSFLAQNAPDLLIPCHGAMVQADGLHQQLTDLLDDLAEGAPADI